MNIEFSKSKRVTYKEIEPGEAFISSRGICLKANSYLAVRIRDGETFLFDNNCLVQRVNAKVVVEE